MHRAFINALDILGQTGVFSLRVNVINESVFMRMRVEASGRIDLQRSANND